MIMQRLSLSILDSLWMNCISESCTMNVVVYLISEDLVFYAKCFLYGGDIDGIDYTVIFVEDDIDSVRFLSPISWFLAFSLLVTSKFLVSVLIENHHLVWSQACVSNNLGSSPVAFSIVLSRSVFLWRVFEMNLLNKTWCRNLYSSNYDHSILATCLDYQRQCFVISSSLLCLLVLCVIWTLVLVLLSIDLSLLFMHACMNICNHCQCLPLLLLFSYH